MMGTASQVEVASLGLELRVVDIAIGIWALGLGFMEGSLRESMVESGERSEMGWGSEVEDVKWRSEGEGEGAGWGSEVEDVK